MAFMLRTMRAPGDWLNARQASQRLDIKLATLYAYASRGLISSIAREGQRGRLYAREDIERLKTRHVARSGHGPVAAAALRFGEPVLETQISEITPLGPSYRGYMAAELCRSGVSFERVCELLWTGALPEQAHELVPALACDVEQLWPLLQGQAVLPKMALILAALAVVDPHRHAATDVAESARARAILHWLARAPGSLPRAHARPECVAETLLAAWRVPRRSTHSRLIDRALVLCAEHELNASTFAARVAASAGADLYACLGAAVNTLSGSAHGGMCDRFEAFLDVTRSKQRAAHAVNEWLARGEQVPGFGHPLYPLGDPRGTLLVELARDHGARTEQAKVAFAVLDAMQRGGHPLPTLDAGLVTLCQSLSLPRGSAATLFAVGRTAGWVAHALEQRQAGYLLRPRARYVPAPQHDAALPNPPPPNSASTPQKTPSRSPHAPKTRLKPAEPSAATRSPRTRAVYR